MVAYAQTRRGSLGIRRGVLMIALGLGCSRGVGAQGDPWGSEPGAEDNDPGDDGTTGDGGSDTGGETHPDTGDDTGDTGDGTGTSGDDDTETSGDDDTETSGDDDTGDSIDDIIDGLPKSCTPLDTSKPDCDKGAYDDETGYCVNVEEAYGPFPGELVDACNDLEGGDQCDTDTWDRALLLGLVDTTGLLTRDLLSALDEIKGRPWLYCQPTEQDHENHGIAFDPDEQPIPAASRSEEIYPPFVLGPRRQMDVLPRQLYSMLPKDVRVTTAFVAADRFIQNPNPYLKYIRSREKVVVVGSFVGLGELNTLPPWALERHANQMWKLRASIQLIASLERTVSDVLFVMGDSSSEYGTLRRGELQARMDAIVAAAELTEAAPPITWGGDETMTIGLSRHLPVMNVKLQFERGDAVHPFDGMRTSREIIDEKLELLKINLVGENEDFEVAIFDRREDGSTDDFEVDDFEQMNLDEAFLDQFSAYTSAQRAKLAIIDGRLANGAWDHRSALNLSCDYLAFGSWGTFSNVVGSTLSAARIIHAHGTEVKRRQLYLEAVAHDVFSNGYAEAQRGALRDAIESIPGITFKHAEGYRTTSAVEPVFGEVNKHVNGRMQEHFSETDCVEDREFRHTPQLWRTFESEVHLLPVQSGEIFVPGVYRTDLGSNFDPTEDGEHGQPLTIEDILAEAD